MADFPYTPQPTSLKRFLDHVQSAGVPEKVSQKYLEKVGFKSKNDRYIISVLKFLGFLDTAGVSTKTWQLYRNRRSAGSVLAGAIRRTYSDLFRTYPDAHRKDNEALRNYFSAHTKVAESTLGLIVTTFKTLCGLAEFNGAGAEESLGAEDAAVPATAGDIPTSALSSPPATPVPNAPPTAPTININIQLQLPATEDGSIYDNLFAALKKHLFS